MLTSVMRVVVGVEETMADAIGLQVGGELYCTSRLGDHSGWQRSGLSGKFEKSIWRYHKALPEHSTRGQIDHATMRKGNRTCSMTDIPTSFAHRDNIPARLLRFPLTIGLACPGNLAVSHELAPLHELIAEKQTLNERSYHVQLVHNGPFITTVANTGLCWRSVAALAAVNIFSLMVLQHV